MGDTSVGFWDLAVATTVRPLAVIVLVLLLAAPTWAKPAQPATEVQGVQWRAYGQEAFAQARASGLPVLLNLEAVWCHWCHVMDATTYVDPQVVEYIRTHYIPVRVDQDARPDLANRYRDYGWPATAVLTGTGTDIVKRAGYIAPQNMLRLLQAIVADPTPERASLPPVLRLAGHSGELADMTRRELSARHERAFDPERGGLRTTQKFLDRDSVEYDLVLAADGDESAARRARTTLDAARALLDPVWGGIYQYSTGGDWQRPHFEKLATIQAEYLRIYSLAYALWGDPRDLAMATAIVGYVRAFLTAPGGQFYVSQDADAVPGQHADDYFKLGDAQRRQRGVPRVDTQVYAHENGRLIEALAVFSSVADQAASYEMALRAADAILLARSGDGGMRRGGNAYLADNLSIGRGCLALFMVAAERRHLQCAAAAAEFIAGQFEHADGGFVGGRSDDPLPAVRQIDENIATVRFLNLVAHYLGSEALAASARRGFGYLTVPDVALSRLTEAGVLLADRELGNDPVHFAVVGPKGAADAGQLFALTAAWPGAYKRVEWWDRAEGPLPNPDVRYPELPRSAGYICTNGLCSVPLFRTVSVAGVCGTAVAAARATRLT